MAHVNVFARVHGAGNPVSVGGRRQQDEVSCWINTANQNGETAMTLSAEVVGNVRSEDRRRSEANGGGDNRKSIFTVELPEETDRNACEVRIENHGYRLAAIARFGAALCGIKAMCHDAQGEHDKADEIRKVLDEIFADADEDKPQGNVTLPGNVPMHAALAAYEILKKVREGELTLN